MSSNDTIPILESAFRHDGFSCETNVDLGRTRVDLCCSKRVRWFLVLPYLLRFFVFALPSNEEPTLPLILGLHALTRAYTDRLHKRPRWFRWRIPITVTVVLTALPCSNTVISHIRNHKQRHQMGDGNTIVIVDTKHGEVYRLEKIGFVGILPLKKTNMLIYQVLSKGGCINTDAPHGA